MNIFVTGGAGFIGSNFVRWILDESIKTDKPAKIDRVIVLDSLTYAGNLENLTGLDENPCFCFIKGDIRDSNLVDEVFENESIDCIVHFAAESHVDRSIHDPLSFVRTNVEGTQVLLHSAMKAAIPKFVHISTDEVYGSLGKDGYFTESTPLDPSSAYSASKAASDMLVLAMYKTHGYPVCVTRCTNNYGPYQFPEKLIPLFVTNALEDKPLPLYGDGKNVRSWLHVDDHSRAISMVMEHGKAGEVYCIGGGQESEKENREVTSIILDFLDKPSSLIKNVEDRKGHDLRYAIDYSKIKKELGWEPNISFSEGLKNTIEWYKNNRNWWERVKSGEYLSFYEKNYKFRSSPHYSR